MSGQTEYDFVQGHLVNKEQLEYSKLKLQSMLKLSYV